MALHVHPLSLQFSQSDIRVMNSQQQPAQDASKSAARKSIVIIGLDPLLIDFSSPDFAAFPGLTAEKVSAGITAAEEGLRALGYDA